MVIKLLIQILQSNDSMIQKPSFCSSSTRILNRWEFYDPNPVHKTYDKLVTQFYDPTCLSTQSYVHEVLI